MFAIALLGLTQCKQAENKAPEVPEPAPFVLASEAQAFAMEAQAALGQTLQKQMAAGGPASAIDFCNLKALPITDSVAATRGVQLARVTDRARNAKNRSTAAETALMEQLRMAPEGIDSLFLEANGVRHYYFPIRTAALCMQCHGTPNEQITPEVLELLSQRYPADSATGYSPGQLRGLWKVSVPLTP